MKTIKKKKVTLKTNHAKPDYTVVNDYFEEPENEKQVLDMEGWEEDFDFDSMSGLFYIQKGQYKDKAYPCMDVKIGVNYMERYVGGYNPADPKTPEQYVVFDRITFQSIYSGHSLKMALDTITRAIVKYKNNPKNYFREVCEYTNEDFYFRKYEGKAPFSDVALKKRAEEGRTWRTSMPMKKIGYAIYKAYNYYYEDAIADAEARAMQQIKERKEQKKEKLHSKKKLVKRIGKR